jgi:hypothetical protein
MASSALPKVTIKKYMGDDQYSWAVFVDGRLVDNVLTGLNRTQAIYYKKQVIDRLKKAQEAKK